MGKLNQQAVQALRELAAQVPGVVALDVHAIQADEIKPAPLAVLNVGSEEVKAPTVQVPKLSYPKLPVIRHIAVGQRERFAVDSHGRKLRVGDTANGAKVVQIRFEAVELSIAGQSYMVAATPMLTRVSD